MFQICVLDQKSSKKKTSVTLWEIMSFAIKKSPLKLVYNSN